MIEMQKKKVLVVDDEHEILRIIDDLLTRNGYHVDTATTCEKALKLFGENEYNTILSDIRMPQKSGIDLLEVVSKSNPELPVVIMTGYASIETAIDALKQGAFDYLTKPLDYQKLKSIIAHAVENNQLRLDKNRLVKELKELNCSLELKVKERNRELLNILGSTKESIITTDREMKIVTSNPATTEIYGDDCLGKRLPEIIEGINFKSVIHNILNDPNYDTKHEIKKNDKFLEVGLSQLIDFETNEVFGTIAVTEDITEKKQLEAQVIQSAKMSAVGQLAAGIAHEFNNILTVIRGYTSIAMTRTNLEEVNRDLQIVENSSDRAADIINKLLTFSRSNEEKYHLVILEELVEDTLALIERAFESEGINILRYFGKIPPVRMNSGEIQQVILNLAINSKHAMKKAGVITIQTEIEDDYVKIDFADTGIGISKENISKIFEPFFTTKNEEVDQEGTGLGLSVVYAIVERHGGKIDVISEVGKGTTFTIKIPNIQRVSDSSNVNLPNIESKNLFLNPKRKGNILVVDDDVSIRNVLKEYLSPMGHNVVITNDGNNISELINNNHFDIIFLNYTMPGKNGLDVLKEIKLLNENVMVVMITGKSPDEIRDDVIAEGAYSFINKPFTINQIQNTVARILGSEV